MTKKMRRKLSEGPPKVTQGTQCRALPKQCFKCDHRPTCRPMDKRNRGSSALSMWVRHVEHGDSLAERSPPEGQRKKISVARSSPRHTREPTRSLGLARRGQLILLDVVRIASWILGTSVPLKKGPSARGL